MALARLRRLSFCELAGLRWEFDLVIVTHSLILVVELKHWRGEITSHGGKRHQDGKETEVSPVDKTRRKTFELRKRIKSLKSRLPNGKEPWIDFCIVLTGKCTRGRRCEGTASGAAGNCQEKG
ncbi:nuclease-related domain-containing protein [Pseudomonas sp. 58(2021)]|uniref:nuclease-related domain-containing protein n=1 Tax=Pseudomonas sp. 58(2021) TaxID=2813330 RepID=UPI001FAF2AE7|nr:nuclease-related domain-containing protein [Pseudomonas sp. 58(2021)]